MDRREYWEWWGTQAADEVDMLQPPNRELLYALNGLELVLRAGYKKRRQLWDRVLDLSQGGDMVWEERSG